jgi:hypothetical protein
MDARLLLIIKACTNGWQVQPVFDCWKVQLNWKIFSGEYFA